MDRTGRVVYLVLSSWSGAVAGAMHLYGRLEVYEDGRTRVPIDVWRPMRADEAIQENKRLVRQGYSPAARPGDRRTALADEAEVVALARTLWREAFPEAAVLMLGNPAYVEPHRVLDAVPGFDTAFLDRLYDTFQEAVKAKEPDRELSVISRLWDAVLEKCLSEEG